MSEPVIKLVVAVPPEEFDFELEASASASSSCQFPVDKPNTSILKKVQNKCLYTSMDFTSKGTYS